MTSAPARRRAAIKAACRAARIPLYAADLVTVRGRCLNRRCGARWGVVRVSLDFTGDTVDRLATVECATCGRTWRRCAVPRLRSLAGYQATRLTLIVPTNGLNRWRSRGRWHREGDDSTVLRDADLGDVDEAATAFNARIGRKIDAKARRIAREAEETRALMARYAEIDAARAAREAEREAEEAAAAAREG